LKTKILINHRQSNEYLGPVCITELTCR